MAAPTPNLVVRQYFVAFLDVLGFSEMVESDFLGQSQENLVKLFRCHQSAAVIFRDDVNCQIIQFSDSIVVAMPYEAARFEWFASRVADYQRLLLDERLLCRGGIAVDQHFSNGSFTFSAGLVRAYRVESQSARYPRVVVSPEVISLVYPNKSDIPSFLVREDDGLLFVDYLGLTRKRKPGLLKSAIEELVAELSQNASPSTREKGHWLAAYSDSILKSSLQVPRFSGRRVHDQKSIK